MLGGGFLGHPSHTANLRTAEVQERLGTYHQTQSWPSTGAVIVHWGSSSLLWAEAWGGLGAP